MTANNAGPSLFRQKALKALQAPEDLSTAIEVVSMRGWIALGVLLILLVFALIWGICGSLSTYVTGQGILLEGQGIDDVISPSAGRLTNIYVEVGDEVESGQIVGKIHALDAENHVALSRSDLDRAQKELQLFSQYDAKTYTAQRQTLAQEQQDTLSAITQVKSQLTAEEERLSQRERLLKEGLVDPDNVMNVKAHLITQERELKALESQLLQLQARSKDLEQQYNRQQSQYKFNIEHSQMVQSQSAKQLDLDENLRAEVNGVVTEIRHYKGDIVNSGESIFSIELESSRTNLTAILYVPASKGKSVWTGMPIKISPSTAKKELYGRMVGTVTFVSPYPESEAAMKAMLHNDLLIRMLTADEPVIRVVARLKLDPNSDSGFVWTSGKGPHYRIQGGTLCEGNIEVETHSPLVSVFPFLYRFGRLIGLR